MALALAVDQEPKGGVERVIGMGYEVGIEYIVTKEMEARLKKDLHQFIKTHIPVGARLSRINLTDEPGRVAFSYESQNYWVFQRKFFECTRRISPSEPKGE
jgi:hypothetical protein